MLTPIIFLSFGFILLVAGAETLVRGSANIANIGLILGITALINPLRINRQLLRNQIPQMIAASLLLWILLLDNSLGFFDGMILTTALLAFLVYNFRQASVET